MNRKIDNNTIKVTCSIIVPVYNTSVDCGVDLVRSFLELSEYKSDICFDLIVVEDGSDADKCINVDYINKNISQFQYISLSSNQGKGAAIRAGVNKCNGDFIIYTDNDFPYSIKSMAAVLEQLLKPEIDFVIGVRPKSYYKSITRSRKLISKMLQMMNKLFLNLPTADTQAGLKGFSKGIKRVFLKTKIAGFLFDLEFLKLAKKEGVNTVLVEIHLRKETQLSEVKIKSLVKELFIYFKLLIGK